MPKALCISGTVIAILMVLLFGLDLAIGFPFGKCSLLMDIGFILAAVLLGAISWLTLREQV